MGSSIVFFFGTVVFSCLATGFGAHILGIFPTPSISHQLPFQVIMKGLVARGHQVTVISPNPLQPPVENYTDIDVSESYELQAKWDPTRWANLNPIDTFSLFHELFIDILHYQLSSPQVQALIQLNASFDLVVLEALVYQSYHGLVHKVGSPPLVGILSLGAATFSFDSMGNPNPPAYCPDLMTPHSDHMTFWQRAYNAYAIMKTRYVLEYEILPSQEKLLRKYFGSAPPSVYESNYNMSLLLLNNHWSLNYPRPLLPNIIELTGLHIQTTPNPLPKDIKSFLDESKHGVIYFSLGSNIKSMTLPKEKLEQILQAFSQIPQHVLWKFEADLLFKKPDNVMLKKWLPQQDILAHPNIRVFITQGGLQSFQEAAYHGVPLIGIPFTADQFHNVAKMEAAKFGVKLEFGNLTKETLLEALSMVLNDSSFQENMKDFSTVYRDQVGPSLDRAIWWIEYVLRHNGAFHLRPASLNLTWYQYLLLDVITVLLLAFLATVFITYILMRKLISLTKKRFSKREKKRFSKRKKKRFSKRELKAN